MGIRSKIAFYRKVNWVKTLYFNFKKFPFAVAKKLPVFFYGPVKFTNIKGEFIIDAPLKRGMIGFGQPYEMNTIHKGIAELNVGGQVVFNGKFQFGKDNLLFVAAGATAQMGNMSGIGSNSIVVCTNRLVLGNYARIASESRISDTDFHQMVNTFTGEKYSINKEIIIGSFNYISSRVQILKGTQTPNYCTVASNSLCNKDYTALGENILIGGYPAKLLKNDISRDWRAELPLLDEWMGLP